MDKVDIKSNYKQNNTIALPEPDKNGFIFEIDDEMYFNTYIYIVLFGFFFFYIHYSNLASESIFRGLAIPAGAYALSYGAWHLYDYYKNGKKIKFYKNRIEWEGLKVNICLSNIISIFKGHFFINSISYVSKIKRINNNLFKLWVIIVWATILFPFVVTIYLITIIKTKRLILPKIIFSIGNNEKQNVIIIQTYIPNNKDKRVIEYFQKYLNTDIEKLETLWFIPKKENTNE